MLLDDQGGSVELGGNESTAGVGTPYIDFHYSGKTQDYNTRIINDADRMLSVVGNLRVLASSNHLQLRRETTETTGDKQLFLELYQDDPKIQVPTVYPSIRFHHNNRFWHRLEARADGFHFKEGCLPNDGYINISAGYIIGKNPYDRNFRDNEGSPSDSARAKEILSGKSDGTFMIGGPTPNYPYHIFFYWKAGGNFYRTWIPIDRNSVESF